MQKAKEWSEKMMTHGIYNSEQSRLTKHQVEAEIAKFGMMLGMFDSIFAQVRGVEAGLLPTEDQIVLLEKTIEQTRVLWISGFRVGGQQTSRSGIFFSMVTWLTRFACSGDSLISLTM